MAERDNEVFMKDVESVRSLLQKRNAIDLEGMLLGGFTDGRLVASLPASLNGKGRK
jgi:hypothetical protein